VFFLAAMDYDREKAKFIVKGCQYVIVDGHHRRHALIMLNNQKMQGLPEYVSLCQSICK
jgi:hypothetical protein